MLVITLESWLDSLYRSQAQIEELLCLLIISIFLVFVLNFLSSFTFIFEPRLFPPKQPSFIFEAISDFSHDFSSEQALH